MVEKPIIVTKMDNEGKHCTYHPTARYLNDANDASSTRLKILDVGSYNGDIISYLKEGSLEDVRMFGYDISKKRYFKWTKCSVYCEADKCI